MKESGEKLFKLSLNLLILINLLVCQKVECEAIVQGERGVVVRAVLMDEPITPVTARYISRAIEEAKRLNARCIVLELDTPGGLMSSTHEIVMKILKSEVPVIVYVSPSGGRAASAGVFITLASHVAVMAPATRIGAAYPVELGGMPGTQPQKEPVEKQDGAASSQQDEPGSHMEEKKINDAVAWVRSLAQMRGRNAEYAVDAVTKSKSLTASEAIQEGVVELICGNMDSLLESVDGREVVLNEKTIVLRTRNASVKLIEMWWGETLLGVISNPNIAFILLILGFYGVLFELYTPGWGVPGTLGAVCLTLGCFGLAVLPVNYAGLLLLIAAMALFIAEAFVTSFGALTAGGVVCLILGGLMLIDTQVSFMRISLGILLPVAIATAGITVFLAFNIVRGHRKKVMTGVDSMIGNSAQAIADFEEADGVYKGMVKVHGEYWRASSSEKITADQKVIITQVRGLQLVVDAQADN